jgi:hypothetical protein
MTGCVACELDDKMPNCHQQCTTHYEGEEEGRRSARRYQAGQSQGRGDCRSDAAGLQWPGCTLLEARTGQQQSRNAVDRPPARGAETPGASGCRQAPGMASERMLAARCLRMCVGNVGVFRHLGMCLVVQIYVGKCLGTCVGMVV